MKCRSVTDIEGRVFQLTVEEEKVMRAIERLEKMDFGRLELFGNGLLDVRINGCWHENSVHPTSIKCEGGDGGD